MFAVLADQLFTRRR